MPITLKTSSPKTDRARELENLHAFSLLCEAWMHVNSERKAVVRGVTIYAPQSLADWLTPFEPEGATDAQRIASVASKIGSGEIRVRAEQVLMAASDFTKLSPEIVDGFLILSAAESKKG